MVCLQDSQENRVKQWNQVYAKLGVFASELSLSNQPVIGDWKITVAASGKKTNTIVQVFDNIEAAFTISVDLPPYLTWSASEMVATVKAKYPNGGPVKGKVIVAVKTGLRDIPGKDMTETNLVSRIPKRKNRRRAYYRSDTIDGQADLEFNLFKDLK